MRQRNLCVELAETGDPSEMLDPGTCRVLGSAHQGPESLREKSDIVSIEKWNSGPGNRYGYKIEEFKS